MVGEDRANHPLTDNRLDTSYLTSPHGGGAGDHRGYFEGRWSHPDGDSAIIRTIDTYRQEQYPYVYPSARVVIESDVTKLSDGRDPILTLRPSLDDPRNVGARSGHHIKVTPGDEMVFKAGLNYSWQDTTMFRDEGVQISIGLTDINGSWKATRFSPTVPAANINSTPAPIEYTFTVPDGVEWAYVIVNIVAPAQTRTGPGSLYFTDLYFGTTSPSRSGASEVGVATVDRRGLVSETFARSREKINVQLAEPDEELLGGERVELAAFAASSSEVTWRWRQITGPEVLLIREGNTCHFQAPDVSTATDMRIAVSASSVDGANRSDWHFFDLEILPTVGRFAAPGGDFEPYTPQMVGYDRGKREIWNDVIAPVGMDPEGRKEPRLVDLGIPADDVTFSLDGEEPARASAGAVYVDIRDGAIYRNFGGGYNETDDTTGAPRRNAYMVNPATGEVFEWIEEADDGR